MEELQASALHEILDRVPHQMQLMDAILLGRAEKMRESLMAEIASIQEGVIRDRLLTLFNNLTKAHRARILISAETGEWLADRQYDRMGKQPLPGAGPRKLCDILERETIIAALLNDTLVSDSISQHQREKIWSPLGDMKATCTKSGWVLERLPTIGGVCAVDFDSPLASRYEARSGTLSRKIREWEAGEQELVLEKLRHALSLIDTAMPGYGSLIRNFTRRIIIRKSVDRSPAKEPEGRITGSEHVTRQPGGIRLLNVHVDEVTIAQCMESLLHESVHNFLAAWETIHGRFATPDEQYRPISPWSGKPIPNASFVHAIFVYYACHNLFQQAYEGASELGFDDLNQAYLKRHLALFGVGFLVSRDLIDLMTMRQALKPELEKAIRQLQQTIREFYRTKGGHPEILTLENAA